MIWSYLAGVLLAVCAPGLRMIPLRIWLLCGWFAFFTGVSTAATVGIIFMLHRSNVDHAGDLLYRLTPFRWNPVVAAVALFFGVLGMALLAISLSDNPTPLPLIEVLTGIELAAWLSAYGYDLELREKEILYGATRSRWSQVNSVTYRKTRAGKVCCQIRTGRRPRFTFLIPADQLLEVREAINRRMHPPEPAAAPFAAGDRSA